MSAVQRAVKAVIRSGCSTPSGYSEAEGVLDAAKDMLREAGARVLGDGAYSVVIAHDDEDKVIKLSLSGSDGYHAYVEWVLANSCTLTRDMARHLPVIHSSVVKGGIRISVLERLKANYGDALDDAQRQIRSGVYLGSLARLIKLLDGVRPDTTCDDISGSNVMLRRGTTVITDPWAGEEFSV